MAGCVLLAPTCEIFAAQLIGILSDKAAGALQRLDIGISADA